MATKVDIWNMALGHLGQTDRVVADSDTTVGAKSCALYWDQVVDDALSDVTWPFATKIAALAGKAAAPNAEWAFSYTYPVDAVTVRKVLNTGARLNYEKSKVPFRRAQDLIFTSVDNAVVEYTMRVTDTTKYPADFIQAVSLLLAHRIAPSVAGGDQIKLGDRALALYKEKILEAAQAAGIEEKDIPEDIAVTGKEGIVNMALALLGVVDEDVQALTTENSLPAKVARQFYDTTRDDVLRAFHWPFATKIAALAGKAAAPNADWAFSYTYPADAVAIRKILDAAGRVPPGQSRIPFKRGTTGLLFTDQDNASVEYTMQNDTPSQYSADFRRAFAIKLAINMAPRVIKAVADRKEVVADLENKYKQQLVEAAANAKQEERDHSKETVAAAEPKEDVCNAALHYLGIDAEIQDLETEQTKEARAFRQFYDIARDKTLRDFDWPFARRVATLVLDTADPTEEWAYGYDMPANAVAIRRILNGTGDRVENEDSRIRFRQFNDGAEQIILTDQADASAVYTARIDDPLLYPADFKDAFAMLLAAKVAPKLFTVAELAKTRIDEKMMAFYRRALGEAATNSAREDMQEDDDDSSLLRARG